MKLYVIKLSSTRDGLKDCNIEGDSSNLWGDISNLWVLGSGEGQLRKASSGQVEK